MAVRVKRYPDSIVEGTNNDQDWTLTQRETTVDGYTFHWGVNEVRTFLDEGVGAAHAAFAPSANITEDAIPFGTSRS